MEQEEKQQKIFIVKTTTGQEKNVARFIAARIKMNDLPIKAILVPEVLKGYIFVEADEIFLVQKAVEGLRHARGTRPEFINFSEIEKYLVRKPIIEELNEKDVVEVTGGPFNGMRAQITRVDKSKEEVTLELLEATFTLPITVHSDYVKLVQKASR